MRIELTWDGSSAPHWIWSPGGPPVTLALPWGNFALHYLYFYHAVNMQMAKLKGAWLSNRAILNIIRYRALWISKCSKVPAHPKCLIIFHLRMITICERIPPVASMPTSTREADLEETNDWWNSSLTAYNTIPIIAYIVHLGCHCWIVWPRKARKKRIPRKKYSATCPVFLNRPWIMSNWCGARPGKKKLRTGTIIREVWSDESIPVDIQKITPIQRITGSQYLTKYLMIIAHFLSYRVSIIK